MSGVTINKVISSFPDLDIPERRPFSVTELNTEVKTWLERTFATVWVEGEVVNFVQASSGHWYFNINDGTSQLRCVCWKGSNFRIRFRPQNGISVRIRGKLTLYPSRGEFQLVVESMEPEGEGALRAAFEQIRERLDSEGLFDPAIKRELPFFPRRVAVVTSPSGAAFHDIYNVLTRRAGKVSILLAPTLVQGEGAADQIRAAVVNINKYNDLLPDSEKIDAMIVGRGGGSAEDLWAFNDEALARCIRASKIPVISAVGHEIDWTISDMIADMRAATPSAAAEMVAAREEDIFGIIDNAEYRIFNSIRTNLREYSIVLNEFMVSLKHNLEAKLVLSQNKLFESKSRLSPELLRSRAATARRSLDIASERSRASINIAFTSKKEKLSIAMARLDALSPLSVLARGYSVVQSEDGTVVRSIQGINKGDELNIRVDDGNISAEVLEVKSS